MDNIKMKNDKKYEPSNKEIKERTKKAIREYVDTCNRKGVKIKSKGQIIGAVKKECKEANLTSKQSLYRFLGEMNCRRVAEGKFDFVIEDNKLSLGEIFHYREYNKMVCFYIDNPEYTNLLTCLINQYYEDQDMSDIIYCIALGEIILCLYYYRKNDERSITKKEIKDDIKRVAKSYTLYAL